MRDYGKIHTSFWSSENIGAMSDDGRLLALYLMTSPHTNLIGCFRVPDGYVSEDLGWVKERVSKGFLNLEENGFATRNGGSKWVVIHKFLKWNEIENPNQGKAAAKLFDQIPAGAGVKHCVAKAFADYAPRVDAAEYAKFLNPQQTLPEPFRNQEQEQEQEQEKEPAPSLRSDAAPVGVLSDEETFWQVLVPQLEAIGIARSRAAQVGKLVGDFARTCQVIREVLKAEKPDPYLGGVLKRLREEAAAEAGVAPTKPKKGEPNPAPEWVQDVRATGARVEWISANRWRDCDGDIVDDRRSVLSG